MDASRLTIAFALIAIAIGMTRFVLGSVGRAGDMMATLFVPPDRTLGWPRGVQESDEPWAWHAPARAAAPQTNPSDLDDRDDRCGPPGDEEWVDPVRGPFTVPVGRVRPVRFGVRPH